MLQVQAYLSEKIIPRGNNIYTYWRTRAVQWPFLAQLARRNLSAPIGSVASERAFKVAKNISSDERTRLLPENVEMLLFLKFNLRAINYDYDL